MKDPKGVALWSLGSAAFVASAEKERVCQNETMDEKTQPVVPSSWEEGLGVVEKNNDITYYKLNI